MKKNLPTPYAGVPKTTKKRTKARINYKNRRTLDWTMAFFGAKLGTNYEQKSKTIKVGRKTYKRGLNRFMNGLDMYIVNVLSNNRAEFKVSRVFNGKKKTSRYSTMISPKAIEIVTNGQKRII